MTGRRVARRRARRWWIAGAALLWVALLGAGELAAERERALVFRWSRVAGAVAYEIEIASDAEFRDVLVKTRVQSPFYVSRQLARRRYYWRVRAVDGDGRTGRYSGVRSMGAVVAPPALLRPAAGARLSWGAAPPRISLAWQRSSALSRYAVEVARDTGFRELVFRRELTGESAQFAPPALGSYVWRVSALDLDGARVSAGEVRSFEVTAAPPQPVSPARGETVSWRRPAQQITLGWRAGPVERSQVEVALDPHFRNVVLRRAAATAVPFELAAARTYHWRVRGVAPATRWSQVMQFSVRPAAPELLAPADAARLPGAGAVTAIEFRWQAGAARGFLLQIRPVDGQQASIQLRSAGSVLTAELPAGQYEWQVSPIDAPERVSEPRSLLVVADRGSTGDATSGTATAGGAAIRPAVGGGTVVHELPAVAAPRPVVRRVRWYAGASLGLFHNLGEIATPRLSVEAALIALRWPGWELGAGLSYYRASAELTDGASGGAFAARLHGLPLQAVLSRVFAGRHLDASVGVGPQLSLLWASVSLMDTALVREARLAFGGVLIGALSRRLGTGTGFLSGQFALSSGSSGAVLVNPGGVTLALGYRWGGW